jgi:T5SS/PEP-CTERM-associated repeat protein
MNFRIWLEGEAPAEPPASPPSEPLFALHRRRRKDTMSERLVGTVMHRMRCDCLIAGFLIWIAFGSRTSEAQYTANYQTNIISGVASNWVSNYLVGSNTLADALLVQNGGALFDKAGFVGYETGSSNNSVLVIDSGSVWSNSFMLTVGYSSGGNSLVISNGGRAVSGVDQGPSAYVGFNSSSSNNSVVVTGTGSRWNETFTLFVGCSGAGNQLLINDGGRVHNRASQVGYNSSGGSNSVVVSGTGSVWSNDDTVSVGYSGAGNSLLISNSGQVINYSASGEYCIVGYNSSSSNNSAVVSGPGSVWSMGGTAGLLIGSSGGGNGLVIGDDGQVIDAQAVVGGDSGGNSVTVTGAGSVWSNAGTLWLGYSGSGNSLTVSNGGQVVNSTGYVGYNPGVSDDGVRVLDGGMWRSSILYIGDFGSSNSLVIGGGSVSAANVTIGAASPTCDNTLELDSGNLMVTNNGAGVLEVRNGQLILNGGVLQADTLVITNSCAQFIHTGGTLIVGNVILDLNTFRIVSIARQSNDMLITWMMGPGATNALQATAGNGSGGYSTNGFTDIFVVTNNTTVGTVTNYLDTGAATNTPSRYYRARLVP